MIYPLSSDEVSKELSKLLDKEVIFREDLEEIFGKRAWDPELTEKPVSSVDNPADAGNVLNTES